MSAKFEKKKKMEKKKEEKNEEKKEEKEKEEKKKERVNDSIPLMYAQDRTVFTSKYVSNGHWRQYPSSTYDDN